MSLLIVCDQQGRIHERNVCPKTYNIQDRARMGMRVDYRLVSQSSMEAELLFGETSGGLSRCAHGKLWYDYLIKLAIGSRDSLLSLMADLSRLDQAAPESLKVFSFQLVGK